MALNLLDITSNNNDLTNNGAAEVTSGLPFIQSTIAVDLEASEADFLTAPDSASLSLTGDFTLEVWVKFESDPGAGNYEILAKQQTNSAGYRLFYEGGSDSLVVVINQTADDTTRDVVKWGWVPTNGQWYHLAVTCTIANATATTFLLYIDTVSQGNGTAAVSGNCSSINNSTGDFTIGAFNEGASAFFDGMIDDVRVWNDVRTSTEIADNYNIELVGNEANLVAYWPFEVISASSPSLSPSVSVSLSPSISTSLSPSVSDSLSPSLTPSISVSLSASLTPSFSPSLSSSISVSLSPSASASLSESLSPSLSSSLSPSSSVSPSLSLSLSPSISVSLTPSVSVSLSISKSPSPSPSASPSISSSLSASISISPTPAAPGNVYSREEQNSLPATNDDLGTLYTTREEYDVYAIDSDNVALTGATGKYLLHEFKKLNDNNTDYIKVKVRLKSTQAPLNTPVYLQRWNESTQAWATIDTGDTQAVNTYFELHYFEKVNHVSYYDFGNEVSFRVYQQNASGSNQVLTVDRVEILFERAYSSQYSDVSTSYSAQYPSKNPQQN